MSVASSSIYTYLAAGATIDMGVNGATTPVRFKYTCPAGKFARLQRCLIQLSDGTAATFITFGGITSLTNGCDFGIYDADDNQLLDLTGGLGWKNNGDLEACCYDVRYDTRGALSNVTARWTFTRDVGGPLILEPGQYLGCVVNDNLNTQDEMYIALRGSLDTI